MISNELFHCCESMSKEFEFESDYKIIIVENSILL
jgi:hypothetical protein